MIEDIEFRLNTRSQLQYRVLKVVTPDDIFCRPTPVWSDWVTINRNPKPKEYNKLALLSEGKV